MARTIGCKVWFDWDLNGTFTEETGNCFADDSRSIHRETLTMGAALSITALSAILRADIRRLTPPRRSMSIFRGGAHITFPVCGNCD